MTQVKENEIVVDEIMHVIDDDEKEEGELSDGCNDVEANGATFEDISSEEEFELRERIAELEAKNLELEKIAKITNNSYELISDSGDFSGSEKNLVGPPSPPQWRNACKDKVPKKRTPQKHHCRGRLNSRRKSINRIEHHKFHKDRARSKRKFHKSRKRKYDKRKEKRAYSSSSSEEFVVDRKELEAALSRDKYRNQYNPTFTSPLSLKDKLWSSPDADILKLSTDEILRLSDSEEAVLKMRLEALKSKSEYREMSPSEDVLIIEPTPMVVDLTIDDKDDILRKRQLEEASLEEQELRLAALKSAYMKKSLERKKRKLMTERPYSPTDHIEKFDCPAIEIVHDETDYSDNNMDISPIDSPKQPIIDDDQPIDMEIAPNSPISFVEALFADDPLLGNVVKEKRDLESHVTEINQSETFANNPCLKGDLVEKNDNKIDLQKSTDNIHQPDIKANGDVDEKEVQNENSVNMVNNMDDDNLADSSLEADCLRSFLLKSIKRKSKLNSSNSSNISVPVEQKKTIQPTSLDDAPNIVLGLRELENDNINETQHSLDENSPIEPIIRNKNAPPKENEVPQFTELPSTNTTLPINPPSVSVPLATLPSNTNQIVSKPKVNTLLKSKSVAPIKAACDISVKSTTNKSDNFIFKKPIIPKTTNLSKPVGITKLKKTQMLSFKKLHTTRKIENINIVPKKINLNSVQKKTITTTQPKLVNKIIPASNPSTSKQQANTIASITPSTSSQPTVSSNQSTQASNRITQTFESIAVPKLIIRLGESDSDSDDFILNPTNNDGKENNSVNHSKEQATENNNNTNFQVKLDEYLKNVRKSVEINRIDELNKIEETKKIDEIINQQNRTPSKTVSVAKSKASTVATTPQAVRHLPPSSQLEYKKLLQRMKFLEQRRMDRLTKTFSETNENISVTVRNDLSEAEKVAIQLASDENLHIKPPMNAITDPINDITVKVQISNNDKRLVTTVKPVVKGSIKNRLSAKNPKASTVVKATNPDNKEASVSESQSKNICENELKYIKLIESLDGKNEDEKLEILKQFEYDYTTFSDSFIEELNGLIGLMQSAQKEKERELQLDNELKQLRQKLEEKEKELLEQTKMCSKIYSKLSCTHQVLMQSRKKCSDIDKYCRKAGNLTIGATYKIPNSKTTIIMDNFRRIAIETKKCKIFNAINLPETEKMDIDENDSQNIEQNDDDNLLTSEITKNEETSNETSITLRQYESPLQAMKSMSASNFDPNDVICPFELAGQCEDPTCQYKHFLNVESPTNSILPNSAISLK